jgi:hypothetical protein
VTKKSPKFEFIFLGAMNKKLEVLQVKKPVSVTDWLCFLARVISQVWLGIHQSHE